MNKIFILFFSYIFLLPTHALNPQSPPKKATPFALRKKVTPSSRDDSQVATLRQMAYFIINGSLESAQKLLEMNKKLDLNLPIDDMGNTLLLQVCELFSAMENPAALAEIIEFLVTNGANINAKNVDQQTILHILCQHSDVNPSIIDYILKKITKKVRDSLDIYGRHALHYAAINNYELAETLLKTTRSEFLLHRDYAGMTPLCLATTSTGALKRGQQLLILSLETRPLVNIAIRDNLQGIIKKALLRYSQDRKDRMLHVATLLGNLEIIKLCVAAGANIKAKLVLEQSFLHLAAQRGFLDIVNFFITAGIDPNIEDLRGITPLHRAAENGHIDIADVLIKSGSLVNVSNYAGATPLSFAAENGQASMLKFLASKGASLENQDHFGSTPLHDAAFFGYEKCITTLLQAGANPRATDFEGATPLHFATMNGHATATKLLATHGASILAEDIGGVTPLDLIPHESFEEIKNAIISGLSSRLGMK